MNKLLDLCEVWDMTFPENMLHSKLYALKPLGMGTPSIESLTSYISRLAGAHSVPLRALVSKELVPILKCDYLLTPFSNSLCSFWKEAARALNGTGALARNWVYAFERLTLRTDLRFLTLLSWSDVLTQQGLLRITRAWCPDCFREWHASGKPIYEPLIWNVRAVSVCVLHKRSLLTQCPHQDCQATLPVLDSHFQPGYCSKCSRWLGVEPASPKHSLINEQRLWQIWAAETVGELLVHNMDLTTLPHLENIPKLIRLSQEQAANGSLQKLAERLRFSRRTLNAWLLGKQVPQLEFLMRLSYYCGISFYDLFTLQSGGFEFSELKIRPLPDIPHPTKTRRSRTPFDAVYIRQSLEAVLACEKQPPPSMRTVAKRLKRSPRELREHFPLLSQAISSRYKKYCKVRGEEKLKQQKEEVRQAILEIHSQGLCIKR